MNDRQEYRMGVGASSILMIFVILCLTTLGVLSYASARADLHLQERRSQQVMSYYRAVAEGETLLAQVDGAIATSWAGGTSYGETLNALGDDRIRVSREGLIYLTIPASPSQQLEILIKAEEPGTLARYEVRHHRLVNIAAWDPEDMPFVTIEDSERGLSAPAS